MCRKAIFWFPIDEMTACRAKVAFVYKTWTVMQPS